MCVGFFSYVEFETLDKALIQFKEEHPLIHRNPETNGFFGNLSNVSSIFSEI